VVHAAALLQALTTPTTPRRATPTPRAVGRRAAMTAGVYTASV
jgi:hypothetical protein